MAFPPAMLPTLKTRLVRKAGENSAISFNFWKRLLPSIIESFAVSVWLKQPFGVVPPVKLSLRKSSMEVLLIVIMELTIDTIWIAATFLSESERIT